MFVLYHHGPIYVIISFHITPRTRKMTAPTLTQHIMGSLAKAPATYTLSLPKPRQEWFSPKNPHSMLPHLKTLLLQGKKTRFLRSLKVKKMFLLTKKMWEKRVSYCKSGRSSISGSLVILARQKWCSWPMWLMLWKKVSLSEWTLKRKRLWIKSLSLIMCFWSCPQFL